MKTFIITGDDICEEGVRRYFKLSSRTNRRSYFRIQISRSPFKGSKEARIYTPMDDFHFPAIEMKCILGHRFRTSIFTRAIDLATELSGINLWDGQRFYVKVN